MKKVGVVLSLGLLLQANNVRTSVCEDAFLGCVAYIQDAISPIIDQYRNALPNLGVLRNYAFFIAQQLIIAAAPSQVVITEAAERLQVAATEPVIAEANMTNPVIEKPIEYPVTLITPVDSIIEYDAKVMTKGLEKERLAEEAKDTFNEENDLQEVKATIQTRKVKLAVQRKKVVMTEERLKKTEAFRKELDKKMERLS